MACSLSLLAAGSAQAAKVRSLAPWKATNVYLVTANLDGRTQPKLEPRARADYVRKGQWVRIACQTRGEKAYGSTLWDRVGQYYVPDRHVKTYTSKRLQGAPSCTPPQPKPPGAPTRYVALGDSFTSGEGAFDYLPEVAPRPASCHRSRNAYPELLAQRLRSGLVHDPARDFLACSGDEVPDLMSRQLGTLGDDVAVVTVGIGGNDSGWIEAVRACMLDALTHPKPGTGKGCTRIIADVFSRRLPELRVRLQDAYNAIRIRAPRAKVIVVGYPALFEDSFKSTACLSTGALTRGARADLRRAAVQLDLEIGAIARANGLGFVDPRDAFKDHRVCGPKEDWIHGLTRAGKGISTISFHPNREGQAGLADVVAAAGPFFE